MLKIYSYKYTSKQLKEKILEGEIDKIKNESPELNNDFEGKMSEYIKSYNYLLNENNENNNLEKDYKNKSIEFFLINEHNNNNHLNTILNNFITYQNNFISNISYKYYQNIKIKEINVQDASENDLPYFCSSDDEFIEIIFNNILVEVNENQNNDIIFNFNFDLEGIEKDLAEKLKPRLKKFKIGEIRTIKYLGNFTNDDIINEFITKYKSKNINQEQQENIDKFFDKFDSKNLNDFLLIIQNVMIYCISNSGLNGETDLNLVIDKISENLDKSRLDLLKSFIDYKPQKHEEDDDEIDLDQMNRIYNENEKEKIKEENVGFSISNLYPIYQSISKLLNN